MAIFFSNVLKQGVFNDDNFKLWICFIVTTLMNCFICKLIEIIKIKLIKINIKKLVPFFIAVFIILFVFVVIALNTSAPIIINENNISDVGARFYTIKDGNPGEYCFITVDYDLGNSVVEYVDGELIGYDICFYGVLENGNYEWIDRIQAVKGNKNREVYFKYNPKYVGLKVNIESVSNKIEDISINLMQIDGNEYILNYKYIPYPIVYFINSISFNNVSISERISLYKDAFNICLKIARCPELLTGRNSVSP